jgi:uncharacterized protein
LSDILLIANKEGQPIGAIPRPPTVNARSILSDRLALGNYGTSFAGARDYFDVLGYPKELTIDSYWGKFERDPLGGRIVEFPPNETWRDTPTVKDGRDKDAKDDTAFAKAWADFAELRRVYHYCKRVDTLCGVGRFGVLLIGVAGDSNLEVEVTRVPNLDQILYLRPYGEPSVSIAEFETDPANPRFGLPRIYNLSVGDPNSTISGGASLPSQTVRVHASRVIHVAEGLLENEVYGMPRLQRVFNLLDDILKLVGGSAEASWLLMRKGFVLNIDPTAELTAEAKESIEQEFEEYEHGIRRFMKTRGVTVSDLGSEVVDPTGLFGVILSLISAATGIPQRILLGSERGELASSQDASNWAGHIASRQLNFAEPAILRPLIDRLIAWGALPKPTAKNYTVIWDPLFELNDQERAQIAATWADAIQKLDSVYGTLPITVEEWRGDFTPFPEELPQSAVEPAPPAAQLANLPGQGGPGNVANLPGQDVLGQVADLVGNAGYSGPEAFALVNAAARLLARNGA